MLRPAERDICEGCTVRGGPPAPSGITVSSVESAAMLPPEIREAQFCDHEGCGNAVLPIEDVDWHQPPGRTREQRRAAGLRTTCLTHAVEPVSA